jgi:phage replication O-like protein O
MELSLMSLPQSNYTQVPNAILDNLYRLKEGEVRVIFAVIRETIGWQSKKRKLSISFLCGKTGMTRQGVVNAIKPLMERGWLKRDPDGQSFLYWLDIQETYEESELVNEIDQSPKLTSQRSRPEVVNEVDQGSGESSQRSRPEVVNEVDQGSGCKSGSASILGVSKERSKEKDQRNLLNKGLHRPVDPTTFRYTPKPWRDECGELRKIFLDYVETQMKGDGGMHPRAMASRHINRLEKDADIDTLNVYWEKAQQKSTPRAERPKPQVADEPMDDAAAYSARVLEAMPW